MGWLFSKEDGGKVAQLDRTLKESFSRVRQDTSVIYQWLAYFQHQTAHQQQLMEEQQHTLDDYEQIMGRHAKEIEHLKAELRAMPKDSTAIKKIIDAYYDFDDILERVRKIEEKVVRVEHSKIAAPVVREIKHEAAALPHVARPVPSRAPALRDKIVQRITRNSKEYLKGIIMNAITKYGQISALQLREMIVEEQGLASKSSFYRFLEELEDEGAVQVVSDGKEKVLQLAGVKKHVEK